MSNSNLKIGDLVKLTTQQWNGVAGIVCQPISEERTGHVLIHASGYIRGIEVSFEDVILAEEKSKGFAQLAYNLIKLGSHVIEKRLL